MLGGQEEEGGWPLSSGGTLSGEVLDAKDSMMEMFGHELHSQMGITCPPAQYGPGLYHCWVHRRGSNIVAVLGEHTARWGEQVGQQMMKRSMVSPVVKGPAVAVRPALVCTLHSTSAGRGCLLFLEYPSAPVCGEPLHPWLTIVSREALSFQTHCPL